MNKPYAHSKRVCTRADVLREQEILKREPMYLDDVENWSYVVHAVRLEPTSKWKKPIKPLNHNARRVEIDPSKQQVRCVETGEVFKNVRDVSRKTKLNRKLIWKCCLNEVDSTVGGYHWEFVD